MVDAREIQPGDKIRFNARALRDQTYAVVETDLSDLGIISVFAAVLLRESDDEQYDLVATGDDDYVELRTDDIDETTKHVRKTDIEVL